MRIALDGFLIISVVLEAIYALRLKAAVSAQKALHGSETKTKELLGGGAEEKSLFHGRGP